jgi:hypothetical protein
VKICLHELQMLEQQFGTPVARVSIARLLGVPPLGSYISRFPQCASGQPWCSSRPCAARVCWRMLAFHRNEHPPPPQLRASVSCVAIPPLVLRGTGLGVLYGHSWPVEMSSVVTRDKQDRDWTSQFFCKRQTGFDASNHRNSMHPATEHVGGGGYTGTS